jgi:hypothetical protein
MDALLELDDVEGTELTSPGITTKQGSPRGLQLKSRKGQSPLAQTRRSQGRELMIPSSLISRLLGKVL